METTVSGLFPDPAMAQHARHELLEAGVAADDVKTLTRETAGLHQVLREQTCDALRGTFIGGVTGALGFGVAALLLSPAGFGAVTLHWAIAGLVGAAIGGGAGSLVGLVICAATGNQVREQLEVSIENGAEMLAIDTHGHAADGVLEVLRRNGAVEVSQHVHVGSRARVPT